MIMATPTPMVEDEVEEVLLSLDEIELAYGREGPEGCGTLQVTSRRVIWKDAVNPEKAFNVDVPTVTLHAISKDPSAFPKPCLYCQITEDEDDDDSTKEVYFVPKDPDCLTSLFEAMSRAAMMNPDPVEPGQEEGDDELIFDNSGLEGLNEEQTNMLEHLESMLTFSGGRPADGRFEDADEEAAEDDDDGDHVGAASGGMTNGDRAVNGSHAMEEDEEN